MTEKFKPSGVYNRTRQDGRIYEVTKNCPCDDCKFRVACVSECVTFTQWTKKAGRK